MKIQLSTPLTPYKAVIDTEAMDVTITETFIGTTFVSPDGERLVIAMRDSGFELTYAPSGEPKHQLSLQHGDVNVRQDLGRGHESY
jgi:hypothetical protein